MYSWTASARIVAASIIDWTNLGQRIGDRERPLADKTMKRIQAGINRYWAVPEREPLIVNQVSGADASRSTPVRDAAPTMVAGGRHASLLVPVEGRAGKAAGSIAEPYRTQTTRNETGLLATAPFIAELRGGGSDARSTTQPLATVTASGNHHALVMRNNHGGAEMSTPVGEPVRTITTAGHQSLISGVLRRSRTAPSGCCRRRRFSKPWRSLRNTGSWVRSVSRSVWLAMQ